jgi:transposase-like protein
MPTSMPECPKCGTVGAELIGTMNQIARFRCKECGHYFYVNQK